MPAFSQRSLERLETCHPALKVLFLEVVRHVDCTILCGHRGEEEQLQAYEDGVSGLLFPESKHNTIPSLAVDVAPWFAEKPHVRWMDKDSWYFFGGYVFRTAHDLGISVRWGGDWDRDLDFRDNHLVDLPHWEIIL